MIKAYAKINLILKVIGKNERNYHLLQMLNARINLYDSITIKKSGKKSELVFLHSNLDPKKDCLVLDVVNYFKDYFGIKDNFTITIKKRIPIGAGLGGGSCDVGAILKFLAKQYQVNIYQEAFIDKLKTYGADIPYALYIDPCIVEGIGEKITKVNFHYPHSFIYIYPNIHASTKEVFQNNQTYSKKISIEEMLLMIKEKGVKAFTNDLQEACENTYPAFKKVIDEIKKEGHVVMSGSGSSILLFNENINRIYKKIKKLYLDFCVKKIKIVRE